jgi:hypothetical protein
VPTFVTFIPAFPRAGWLGALIRHHISRLFRKRPPEKKLATRSDMQRLVEHFNKRST